MYSRKLETFLVLLSTCIFQNGCIDTAVSSTESYSKSSVINDQTEATTENLSNATPTNSVKITTDSTTQSKSTIASSTQKTGGDSGEPFIHGPGIQWFKENSSFEIFCSYSDGLISTDLLKFYDVSGNELNGNRGFLKTVINSNQNQVNVSLSKDRIQTGDIGRYICRYRDGPPTYIHVAVVQVNTTPQIYNRSLEPQEDYTISCVFRAVVDTDTKSMVKSEEVLWFKDNIAADQISTRHIANGSMLTIKTAVWSDVGLYSCDYRVTWGVNNVTVIPSTVAFKGEPRINDGSLPKSVNLIQDEDLELTCPVSGYPHPNVTWQMDGMEISPDNRRTTSPDPTGKYQNAVLKVFKVQFEDRGTYTCTGSSDLNTVTSASITVRVKDKYAAVWPFIGIVVEVIVLCIVIFLCEKRKKHREEQAEADTDLNTTAAKRTSEKRQSEVRQRSTIQ